MKILFVTDLYPGTHSVPPQRVSRALHQFVRTWRQHGHDVFVLRPVPVYPVRGIPRTSFAEIDGVPVLSCPHVKLPRSDTVVLAHLRRALAARGVGADVVIGHLTLSHRTAIGLAHHFDAPCVLGVHRSDVEQPLRLGHNIALADRIAFRSHAVERIALKMFPDLAEHSFVALSGVDAGIIEPLEIFRRKADEIAGGGRRVIASVCRLLPLKNLDVTIEALAKLQAHDWEYRVIGDGPERPRLEAAARQHGIADRVHFTGELPHAQVLDALREVHVFVMVSAPETFGLSYLEAMARGAVVVGARGEGIDGVVRDGENGYLCEPRSAGELESTLAGIFRAGATELQNLQNHAHHTVSALTTETTGMRYLEQLEALVLETDTRRKGR